MVLAIPFVLGACVDAGGGEIGTVPATVGTAPPQTTTTNPYAVPPVIDAAYINRVLAGLDAALGDILRLVVSTRTIPPVVETQLRSIYATDDWMQLQMDLLQLELMDGFTGLRPVPGNQVTVVEEILSASLTCVFARVKRDNSQISSSQNTPAMQWAALVPLDPSRDPSRYNVTGWAYRYNGFPPDRAQPSNPCR